VNDTTQIYDFNPGFGPKVSNVDSGNGFGTRVFWTAVIPDSDVQVNPAAGTATLDVSNLAEVNYFSKTGGAGNLSLGPNWQTAGIDATVSFHVAWNGPVTRRVNVKDATDGFAGLFNEVNNNNVTVSWSGRNASGFSFTSNVGNLATSTALAPGNFFAQLAQERNGVFFPQGDSGASPPPPASVLLTQPGGTQAVLPISAALAPDGMDLGGVERFASPAQPSASDWATPSQAPQTARAAVPASASLALQGGTETRSEVSDQLFVDLANAPADGLLQF
jgi:hypothetical protein